MAGTRGTGARTRGQTHPRPGSRPRRRRRAGLVPVLGAVVAGLLGLAFVPGPPDGEGARAVDAAAVGPVVPANGFSSSGGTGAIIVPAPAVAAPPSMVVPRPEVIRQAIVPPYVPVGAAPTLRPPPAKCGGYSTPRRITPTVVAGAGSATVTFPSDTSADVQRYRVQAVSQRLVTGTQPPHVVGTAPQRTGCGDVSLTLTGLTSGDHYVFWLEEQQVDPGNGRTLFVQVGSSEPVAIG
ncbi:MAG: uncharacterized protein JWO98_4805 [Frankiales bacterium]|nr:uncharacterized protein [Frankiales bacterium]